MTKQRQRMLDLRSGGWLILLAVALVALIVWWMVLPVLRSASQAVGDGRDAATYGFDLASFELPRELLVGAGFPKNGIPSLYSPESMPGAEVLAFNANHRGKYLVSDDRVIGVVLGGESRAYPLRVLNWHEVINDTLGGVPIAVTYHPLCDSAVVFDRRVDGETLEFGVSGLLFNSNLLLFDRRDEEREESLWSQLLARPVAGPAATAGWRLRILPSSLALWRQWLDRHPETTVVRPGEKLLERYRRDPYGNYLMTGDLRFPVDPLPPEGSHPLMSPVAAYREAGDDAWSVCPLVACDGGAGEGSAECAPCERLLLSRGERSTGVIADLGPDAEVIYSLWFAWYAHRTLTRP